MKYIFLSLLALFLTFSCTENSRAKSFGGNATIQLPKGYKLNEATWEENDLWYLLEPVDSSYIPKVKIFQEDSNYGLMNGKIRFVETN